jgi:N utilization substance protein A
VQAVVQELRGEKIDIVPYDRDPARFVCNAIAPAEVARVIIDEANSAMELVVPDDKLSLAIGRRGQNVRLASQLTGWRLDVIGESKFKLMEEEAIAALASIEKLDRNLALTLYKQGFRSLDEVAEASEQELGSLEGLGGPSNAAALRRRAGEAMERLRAKRVEEASQGDKVIGDRDMLLLMPGVTARVADLLHHAGYRTPLDVNAEQDIDRLAIRTGLGSRKAQELREAVAAYLERDAARVDEGQQQARSHQAEAEARLRAEAQARAEAESVRATPPPVAPAAPTADMARAKGDGEAG